VRRFYKHWTSACRLSGARAVSAVFRLRDLQAASSAWRVSLACCVGQLALLASAVARAAEPTRGPLGGVQGPDLPFPSVGRLIFGFLFTVLLAVGAAYALKRWWPLLSRRRGIPMTGSIRTVDRTVVSATLSVYVLEVEGTRFLVAEGRSGISVTPMQREQ